MRAVFSVLIGLLMFFIPTYVYADSLDIPIDQYYQFGSDHPQGPVTNSYLTGRWNGIQYYLLFKVSDMTRYNTLLQGASIQYYQLKITDPSDSTGADYLSPAALWYSCSDPAEHVYADVVPCALYPQWPFLIHRTGTTSQIFDYSPTDAFTHWVLFTGQETGLKIDPTKLWWHVEYTPPTPTPTPLPKPGDVNNDHLVNDLDYQIIQSHYLQSVSGVANGDVNGDSVVDGLDYAIWLTNYGT